MTLFLRKILLRFTSRKYILHDAVMVNNDYINKILIDNIPNMGSKVKRIAFDSKYYLGNKKHIEKLIKDGVVETIKYKSNVFDCDDFSRLFAAIVNLQTGINSVGVVIDYTGGHAYNIMIFDDDRIAFFEPQNNTFVRLTNKGAYQLKSGYIIL